MTRGVVVNGRDGAAADGGEPLSKLLTLSRAVCFPRKDCWPGDDRVKKRDIIMVERGMMDAKTGYCSCSCCCRCGVVTATISSKETSPNTASWASSTTDRGVVVVVLPVSSCRTGVEIERTAAARGDSAMLSGSSCAREERMLLAVRAPWLLTLPGGPVDLDVQVRVALTLVQSTVGCCWSEVSLRTRPARITGAECWMSVATVGSG